MSINVYPPVTSSGGGTTTPTTLQENLEVDDNTQMVFSRQLVTTAGQSIILGAGSVLVGV